MNNQLKFYLHTDNILYKILFEYDSKSDKYNLIVKNPKNNKTKAFNRQIKIPDNFKLFEIIENFLAPEGITQFFNT